MAAGTTRPRVMTHLVVAPYRNPFVSARSMASLDRLSGGRATFVLGTGYLRSEFAALGVEFEERNELFDEAAEVIRGVWTDDDFHYTARHFNAFGVKMLPGPVQQPYPPLWVGGNSAAARRRVAAWAQGWAPLLGSAQLARTARTPIISTDRDLARL